MEEEKTPEELFEVWKNDFISKQRNDLPIKRVPKPTLEAFKKKANEEFAGDYGMLLKYLWDFHEGLIPENETLQNLLEEISMLKERITILEQRKEEALLEPIIASDRTILGYKTKR